MRRRVTSAVLAGVMSAGVSVAAAAQPPGPPPALTVCLTMSHAVAAAARREGAVLEEVEAIWRSMGVAVRLGRRSRESPLREGVTVIGRAEDADLRISLPSLSRHHARVVVRGLEATLEDLGSRHGSWRGTTPVQGVVRLASGDEIRLGTTTLVYCLAMPDDTTRN